MLQSIIYVCTHHVKHETDKTDMISFDTGHLEVGFIESAGQKKTYRCK